jgi:hypothetical protein
MRFSRRGMGQRANQAAQGFATRLDGQTTEVAARAARAIAVAVRLARVPSLVLGAVSVPPIIATILLGLIADGGVGIVVLVAGNAMAAVNAMYWGRRSRVLAAVEDPVTLGSELAIVVSMTDKVSDTRGALTQIAGGGGWRVLNRLRGVWSTAGMSGRWISGVSDLPRAKYFAPPKIGTTVSLVIASLWLVPVSYVVALFALLGTLANSI